MLPDGGDGPGVAADKRIWCKANDVIVNVVRIDNAVVCGVIVDK